MTITTEGNPLAARAIFPCGCWASYVPARPDREARLAGRCPTHAAEAQAQREAIVRAAVARCEATGGHRYPLRADGTPHGYCPGCGLYLGLGPGDVWRAA